jgi:hypothetical protein
MNCFSSTNHNISVRDATATEMSPIWQPAKDSCVTVLRGNASFSTKYNHIAMVVLIVCLFWWVLKRNSLVHNFVILLQIIDLLIDSPEEACRLRLFRKV